MVLRWIALGAAALVGVSIVINLARGSMVRDLFSPAPEKAPPIVFDNGSARDVPPPPAPAAASGPAPKTYAPPGLMRKCVRGDKVTYSNLDCPPGFKESTVSQEGVTVVPSK